MTIREAIAALDRITAKHGDDIEVFFDCPHCLRSFTPDKAVTVAARLQAKPEAAARSREDER